MCSVLEGYFRLVISTLKMHSLSKAYCSLGKEALNSGRPLPTFQRNVDLSEERARCLNVTVLWDATPTSMAGRYWRFQGASMFPEAGGIEVCNGVPDCTSPVRVRVTLQLTVSQSVCLGVEPNLGLLTRDITFFFF
jgi:hypothetical protein